MPFRKGDQIFCSPDANFHFQYYVCDSGDQGNGTISRIDVASVAVTCVEGHCTPNVTFEVFNSKNKYSPAENLSKLYSLESDEPVVEDSESTGRLLP